MISKKNLIYRGAENRESLFDLEIPNDFNGCLILFVHGYKGYKDWGAWNLVQDYFVENNYGFAKMNLSHNGGTIDDPIDFPDLEAFGKNCYSFEVFDIECCLNEIKTVLENETISFNKTILIGHSRGGGDVILANDSCHIDAICTWAGISNIESRFPKEGSTEDLAWKESGVRYVLNGRTKQEMPHFYSMMEDFLENKHSLSIQSACKELSIPTLHIHGTDDKAVLLDEAKQLEKWTGGRLEIIENGNHTFNAKHPWESRELPNDLNQVCGLTLNFLNENL